MNNFEEDFKKCSRDAHGVFFWESEYWKRKFLKENESAIEDLRNDIGAVSDFLKQSIDPKYANIDFNCKKNGIKLMQIEFYRRLLKDYNSKYASPDNGFDLRLLLTGCSFPEVIEDKLYKMNSYSFNYRYYIDDLISRTDMNDLASCVLIADGLLPEAPPLFNNKDAVPEISENVYRSGFAVRDVDKIKIFFCEKQFSCDYLAMVNFRHDDFNYSEVVSCFRKQLAFLIYSHNGYNNLSKEEKKDLTYTFKSDAGKGYGSEFSSSRAIGLLIWDYKFSNSKLKKLPEIFNCISDSAFKDYLCFTSAKSGSAMYKRLSRILDVTNDCVASGKVLPIQNVTKKLP